MKKDKKLKLNEEVDMLVVKSISEKKSKKRKRKLDTSLEEPESGKEETVVKESKKSKKRSKSKTYENEIADDKLENAMSEQPPSTKKSKKEKKRKPAEESLGVVDTDILRQAETNLGLPMADDVSSQKENSEEQHAKKKKKKKDKKLEAVSSNEPNNDKTRNERAIQYIRLWHSHKKAWKFNKMMQVHLLHIMYDKSLMIDEDFEILLLYLDGMKGKGREKTMEDAKKILDSEGTEGAEDAIKEGRSRQIFQMLA